MPKVPPRTKVPKLTMRLHPSQRKALEKIAKQRGTTATALVRDQIAALTGVEDPLPRWGRKGVGASRPGVPRGPKAKT